MTRSERAVKAARARWGDNGTRGPNATRDCAVEGCEAPNFVRGWCQKHYGRWQRHGEPEPEHLQPRECANCPAIFTPGRAYRGTTATLFCSPLCADVATGRRSIGPTGWVITCAVCGDRKAVGNPVAKSCRDCREVWSSLTRASWRVKNPDRWRELNRRRDQRRSALRRGAAAVVEDITAAEIYDRDGWRCGLCGGRVSRVKRYPHPKSASLDHVVPVSLGGTHTLANVQLAHWECNRSKGVRAMNEQLKLVG